MSSDEIAVTLICLVAGYWAVSAWLGRSANKGPGGGGDSARREPPRPDPSRPDGSRNDPPPARPIPIDPLAASWSTTLGVSPSAPRDEITHAYKRLISEYHPDKVANAGAEIRELAERKSKEINAAYDFAMKLRR